MATGPVVGRDQELAAADRFLEDAAGAPRALVLEGEPGIGKSTVWNEVVLRAERRGFRVLTTRPAQAEARLSLASLADLLEPVPDDHFAGLPPPQRAALEAALMRSTGHRAPPERLALAAGVRALVRSLSAERPLLLAVDDAQWLDRPTAGVMEFVVRRIESGPVGILASVRTKDGSPPRTFERGFAQDRSERIALGALSVAAVHQILRSQLGRSFPRPTVVRIAQGSAGNPLYALEIARELLATGRGALTHLPAPAELRRLIGRRLRRLPAPTREALLIAAALSDPTVGDLDAAALAPAEDAGIVRLDRDRVAFVHPLYASAVYAAASSVRRRQLHSTLASLVDDPEERARHLALSATGPDRSVAQALADGAAWARARGAWGSAAELLERARELTPRELTEEIHARGIEAAEHRAHAGDRSGARALLDAILREPLPRPQRAVALRLLAEITSHDENFAGAAAIYGEALEHADDPRLVVAIECGLAYVHTGGWDFPEAALHAHHALEVAEVHGDAQHLASALAVCAMLDYLVGRGVAWDAVERSLGLEDPRAVMPLQWRPSTIAALLHAYAGSAREARQRLRAVWTGAIERGDESDIAFILILLGWHETRCANLEEAARLAEQAAALAALTGSDSLLAWALAQQAFVHAHRGEAAETRRSAGEAAAVLERVDFVVPRIWVAAALGQLELSLGNAEAAWAACAPLTEALEQRGIAEPIPAFFLPDALEALIALGRLDRARALVDALEARGRELDRAWALAVAGRCRGLLLAAVGDLAGAGRALAEAITEHGRLEMPLELARTLLHLGRVQRRLRQRKAAQRTLERALELFGSVGSPLWAEQAGRDLARLGLRRGTEGLTEGEARVAQLAATGLTNREIAARLFVSRRTVEANLARAYRKLGIRSRAELGARMAAREPAAAVAGSMSPSDPAP